MPILVTDPNLEGRLISERQNAHCDGFDEVWEGLYIMAPLPNDEHQDIQARFVAAFQDALGWDSLAKVRAGVNVSDRNDGWMENFRCPDVVIFLPGSTAVNHGPHWEGGPDFLIEIVSGGDRAPEKLPFYAKVGVREALIIHRNPWSMELYALAGSPAVMQLIGIATPDNKTELRSNVLPLLFQLHAAATRPRIKAALTGTLALESTRGRTSWLI